MRFAHSLRRPASSHRSAPGVSAGARSSHSPRPKRGAILARSSQLRHRHGPITGLTRRFRAGCPIACLVGFLQKRVILGAADTPYYLIVQLDVRRHKRRDPYRHRLPGPPGDPLGHRVGGPGAGPVAHQRLSNSCTMRQTNVPAVDLSPYQALRTCVRHRYAEIIQRRFTGCPVIDTP